MYFFFTFQQNDVSNVVTLLVTASAKERKKNPDSTLHHWASRVYPSPDGEVVPVRAL